eukprot:scaffold85737_cov56-Cyclotella_meneghiniana.AAC.2
MTIDQQSTRCAHNTRISGINKKWSENTPRNNPLVLSGGVEITVEMTLSEYLVLERFVLRRGGETVAIGLIETLIHKK